MLYWSSLIFYWIDRMDLSPQTLYWHKMFHLVITGIVLVGAVNWLGVGLVGVDYVRQILGRRTAAWVYCIVGVSALLLIFRRDTYLPFLGSTLFPAAALSPRVPQSATETITIHTRPNAKVVYWAAEPNPTADSKNLPAWDKAYSDYENSGVVEANESGVAILRIRGPPEAYKVPFHGRLEPHVHFREEEANGFFGHVKTYYIGTGKVEGFSDYAVLSGREDSVRRVGNAQAAVAAKEAAEAREVAASKARAAASEQAYLSMNADLA
jgi:uncharacterized membrane protein YuzA (DUF378 family)